MLGVGSYLVARDTSLFAVRSIDVRGGTPQMRAEVTAALRGELGESLLRVDGASIGGRLATIPTIRSFRYDRAFPNTLRIVIRPEEPVLVLRQSSHAYLVAASGRVLQTMLHPRRSSLPRLYVAKSVPVAVGGLLPAALASAAGALAPLGDNPLPGGVEQVRTGSELTLLLHTGFEVRLGDGSDVRLKLAIARRILALTGAATDATGYLDVSVPQRPVLFGNSQVEG